MSYANLSSALRQAYDNGGFGLDTEYQNKKTDFDKKPSSPWARVTIGGADPEASTMGSAGDDEHLSFMQIDLFYPKNEGVFNVFAKADEISAVFKAGASFIYGDDAVTIRNCGRDTGANVDLWYRVIITINWYAHVSRA